MGPGINQRQWTVLSTIKILNVERQSIILTIKKLVDEKDPVIVFSSWRSQELANEISSIPNHSIKYHQQMRGKMAPWQNHLSPEFMPVLDRAGLMSKCWRRFQMKLFLPIPGVVSI